MISHAVQKAKPSTHTWTQRWKYFQLPTPPDTQHTKDIATSRITVRLTADKMTATAAVSSGAPASMSDLREALARARVVAIADSSAIATLAEALANPKFACGETVIARGLPAVAGKDGYFEPAFHAGLQAGHIGADGTMDFFDRELLKSFDSDTCVGQLHVPVPGTPGRRLDGSEIKVPPVRPSKLRVGANLRVLGDGRVFTSKAGVVLYVPEQTLELVEHHIHPSDVDMRSGNLDMKGSLVVRGTVQRLFHVRATRDLEVLGGVDSGSVFAGGSVRIAGLVRGGESGMVCAEGNVSARQVEAAQIVAGGALKLDAAINSTLAAGSVQIARSVRGGTTHAETTLTVMEASAAHGTGALLAAAMPLSRPVLDLQASLRVMKDQRSLGHGAGGVRGDGERNKGGKLERQRSLGQQAELAQRAAQAERRSALMSTARVQILGKGEMGVTIQIGVHTLVLKEDTRAVRFVYDPKTRAIRAERSSQ